MHDALQVQVSLVLLLGRENYKYANAKWGITTVTTAIKDVEVNGKVSASC